MPAHLFARPAMSSLKNPARVAWSLLRPHRGRVVLAAIALVVAALAMLGVGQGLRAVIDRGFSAGDPAWLDRALLMMFGIIALLAAATYTRFYNVSWLGERVTADLRRRVFDHLLTLPPSYFEAGRTGAVISRLTSDTTLIENAVGSSLSIALRNLLILIGGLVMLFTTNLKLTLLVLGGVPLVVAPIVLFGRRVRRFARISQDRVADLGNRIDETIHEIRIVQAYGHEAADRREFGRPHRARLRHRAGAHPQPRHAGRRGAGAGVRRDLADPLGRRPRRAGRAASRRGSSRPSSSMPHWSAVRSAPVRILGRPAARRRRHRAPAGTARSAAGRRRAASADSPAGASARRDRLRGGGFPLSLAARHAGAGTLQPARGAGRDRGPGRPSGAGKTTVFQLLLRFYDPQSGRLLLDGVPLAEADPLAVRRAIALVPQEAVIFATSVLENVRYARPEASAEEVRAACAAAYADDFVTQLPQGYDTDLGERGVRLSGGQRQRIAIARALLADRPILLLDEATSALDAESERLVQAALEGLMKNRTTLVIAHRLATVQRADRIVVMDQGRIVETGTHAELVRQDGLYAHLARLQFAA
jgi:ATP-binding cassette subfamily B protein